MTKREATREGKALLKKMKTKGWKLMVWENQGWHYSISRGFIRVDEHGGRYSCLMSETIGMGEVFWETGENSFKDPNKAVEHQLEVARKFVDKCKEVIDKSDDPYIFRAEGF